MGTLRIPTWLLLIMAGLLVFLGQFALAHTPFQSRGRHTIYGMDGRKDFFELHGERLKTTARKTVALISSRQIPNTKSRLKYINGPTYGSNSKLCRDEKFLEQPSVAFCSGVLIGPRQVLTAGHCITDSSCNATSFVLDFLLEDGSDQKGVSVDEDKIYTCRKISQRVVSGGLDFAVVELDRSVSDRRAVTLKSDVKSEGTLLSIGFPEGIPLKVAFGGLIRRETKNFIVAGLDVFGGNSGSPVYNEDLELIGILLRGEKDYEYDRSLGCYHERRCGDSSCSGETILKASTIFGRINYGVLDSELLGQ